MVSVTLKYFTEEGRDSRQVAASGNLWSGALRIGNYYYYDNGGKYGNKHSWIICGIELSNGQSYKTIELIMSQVAGGDTKSPQALLHVLCSKVTGLNEGKPFQFHGQIHSEFQVDRWLTGWGRLKRVYQFTGDSYR